VRFADLIGPGAGSIFGAAIPVLAGLRHPEQGVHGIAVLGAELDTRKNLARLAAF